MDIAKIDNIKKQTLDSETMREVIEYKKRRIFVIFLFLFLLLLPFAFAIESYMALRSCQGKESNGCPTVSLSSVRDTAFGSAIPGHSQELSTDYTKNSDVQKLI